MEIQKIIIIFIFIMQFFNPIMNASSEINSVPWIDFGQVYINSIVEGELRIFSENCHFETPDWVTIDDIDTHRADETTLWFSIDTNNSGVYMDDIYIMANSETKSVTIKVKIIDSPEPLLKVLVYPSPFAQASEPTYQGELLNLVKESQLDINYASGCPSNEVHRYGVSAFDFELSDFDVVIFNTAVFNLEVDTNIVEQYVKNGGNLILFAKHYERANRFMPKYGLKLMVEELSRYQIANDISEHYLTVGINQLNMFRPYAIKILNDDYNPIILGKLSSQQDNEGLAVYVEDNGTILLISSKAWWYFFLYKSTEYDNKALLKNYFRFISGVQESQERASEQTNITQEEPITPGLRIPGFPVVSLFLGILVILSILYRRAWMRGGASILRGYDAGLIH